MFIFKIMHGLIKNNIELTIVSQVHSYTTRQRNQIYINSSRTVRASKNVFVRGLKLYNRLPINIKVNNIVCYKQKLKPYIFQNYDSLVANL